MGEEILRYSIDGRQRHHPRPRDRAAHQFGPLERWHFGIVMYAETTQRFTFSDNSSHNKTCIACIKGTILTLSVMTHAAVSSSTVVTGGGVTTSSAKNLFLLAMSTDAGLGLIAPIAEIVLRRYRYNWLIWSGMRRSPLIRATQARWLK